MANQELLSKTLKPLIQAKTASMTNVFAFAHTELRKTCEVIVAAFTKSQQNNANLKGYNSFRMSSGQLPSCLTEHLRVRYGITGLSYGLD